MNGWNGKFLGTEKKQEMKQTGMECRRREGRKKDVKGRKGEIKELEKIAR